MFKRILKQSTIFFLLLFFIVFVQFRVVQAADTFEQTDASFNESLIKFQQLLRLFTSINPNSFTDTTATPTPSLVDISQTPITGSKTELVTELVNRIRETCPQGVNYNSVNCLNNYPSPFNKTVPALVTSASLFRNLQCVGFIKGVEEMTNNTTWGIVGNAGGLLAYPPSGGYIPFLNTSSLEVGPNSLQAEDLAIYDYDTFGHIAYVLSRNGNLFTVAEANWNNNGNVAIRIDSVNNPHLAGWLKKQ